MTIADHLKIINEARDQVRNTDWFKMAVSIEKAARLTAS